MTCTTPIAITDHQRSGLLEIAWSDGHVSRLSHGLLREQCRCGGCEQQRRHGPGMAATDEALRLTHIEPVGERALNLGFSDGHARGIYPWTLLRQLGAP